MWTDGMSTYEQNDFNTSVLLPDITTTLPSNHFLTAITADFNGCTAYNSLQVCLFLFFSIIYIIRKVENIDIQNQVSLNKIVISMKPLFIQVLKRDGWVLFVQLFNLL